MRPLRITAFIQSPLVGDWTFPIDGLLCYLACVKYLPPQYIHTPKTPLPHPPEIVPLRRIGRDEEWIYQASFAQWGSYTEGIDHWNKRYDAFHARVYSMQQKVDTTSGQYKSYHYAITYRVTDRLWWDVVGDKIEIEELLSAMPAIGKKTAQGYGQVREWLVEEVDGDALHGIFDARGRLMRALPEALLPEVGVEACAASLSMCGYRPPYWAWENQGVCYVPSSKGG